MGERHFVAAPSAFYGVGLLISAIADYISQRQIICSQDGESVLTEGDRERLEGENFSGDLCGGDCGAFRSGWIV